MPWTAKAKCQKERHRYCFVGAVDCAPWHCCQHLRPTTWKGRYFQVVIERTRTHSPCWISGILYARRSSVPAANTNETPMSNDFLSAVSVLRPLPYRLRTSRYRPQICRCLLLPDRFAKFNADRPPLLPMQNYPNGCRKNLYGLPFNKPFLNKRPK